MRVSAAIFGSALLFVCAPASAWAQAYLDEPGSLSASATYTFAPSGKVVATSGSDDDPVVNEVPGQTVFAHILNISTQYTTPLEGLAVDAELPVVGIRVGDKAFMHFPEPGEYDDGDYHFTPTDFRAGVRYQLKQIEQYLGLSFSVAGSVPVADYPKTGLAAPAHGLKALHLGVAVARPLYPIAPNLVVSADYEFSLREKVDVDPSTEKFGRNRSNFGFSLGYILPANFYVAASGTAQFSHGGLAFKDLIFEPPAVQDNHDRLLDEDFALVGGDLGYAVSDDLSLGVAARFFVWGRNTRNQNLFGLTGSYRFF